MSPVHKLSAMGSITSNKIDYPSMLAGYGDFGAMQRIGYQVATTNISQFSFTNIPQIYQDLVLVTSWRDTTASTGNSSIYLTTNHYDGTSFYSQTLLSGDGSTATSTRATAKGYADTLGFVPMNSNTSGIFGSAIFHFLNYKTTSANKTYLVRTSADLNGSGNTSLAVGLIAKTPAITSINVSTLALVLAGSSAALYGVKASAA